MPWVNSGTINANASAESRLTVKRWLHQPGTVERRAETSYPVQLRHVNNTGGTLPPPAAARLQVE